MDQLYQRQHLLKMAQRLELNYFSMKINKCFFFLPAISNDCQVVKMTNEQLKLRAIGTFFLNCLSQLVCILVVYFAVEHPFDSVKDEV